MQEGNHTPTLVERLLLAAGYLFTGGIGASVLLWPAYNSVTDALGVIMTVVWAAFIMSSLLCVPAAILGRYRVEYVLIPFFTTALAVAVISTWFHTAEDPSITARACTATALVLTFSLRYASLSRLLKNKRSLERGRWLWTRN